GQFKRNNQLGSLSLQMNRISKIGKDAFLIDAGPAWSGYPRTLYLRGNLLNDDGVDAGHGLEGWEGTVLLNLWENQFEFFSEEKWGPYLAFNRDNTLEGQDNKFICDLRMKWQVFFVF